MGMIPQVTCRHCRKKYSKLKRHCPYCGLERVKHSTRTPASTASTVKETSASQRAKNASKYRMIFCAVILVAVVGCTIAMVSLSIHKSDAAGKQEQSQSEQNTKDGQATTALSKDDEKNEDNSDDKNNTDDSNKNNEDGDGNKDNNSNNAATTSVSITYLSAEKNEFSMNVGDNIQLDATVYPLNDEKEVVWSSSDTSVLTVTNGLVTGVASGEANVIATCDGVQATCRVLVW